VAITPTSLVLEQDDSIVVVGGTNAKGVNEVANEVSWRLAEEQPSVTAPAL
jgi:hypothetical protein